MPEKESPVALRSALRRLAEEARHRAAVLPAGGAEHDFYAGVSTAAEDMARHGQPRPLPPDRPAFSEGYARVVALAGAAAGHAPVRFPLPTPPGSPG